MAVDRSASPDVQRLHIYTQLNAPMAETNITHINASLLTALPQFALGRPGPLLCVSWYLLVQCLLGYPLVFHTENTSKPAKSSFSQYVVVVHGLLYGYGSDFIRLLSCIFTRCPVYSSAICDVQHPVFLLTLLPIMAIYQHRAGELTRLLLLVFTFRIMN